jgi:hypothetical protein
MRQTLRFSPNVLQELISECRAFDSLPKDAGSEWRAGPVRARFQGQLLH